MGQASPENLSLRDWHAPLALTLFYFFPFFFLILVRYFFLFGCGWATSFFIYIIIAFEVRMMLAEMESTLESIFGARASSASKYFQHLM